MKKILVAGGAGFLGCHLCKKLIEKKNKVICLDNLFTGNKKNIESLLTDSNFSFIEKDITEKINIEVNEIYNLACPASPKHYQLYPVKTTITSVLGSLNLLNLAKYNNAKILQASTSEIYGDPNEHPQKENYWGNVNPIGLRSCYDEGKRCAETLFFDFWRNHQVKIKVARIFNTYGPKMDSNDGRVISNFIVKALNNQNLEIYGDGNQTRSFCYVDDLIEGLYLIMESVDNFVGPVNIGSNYELSINEIAKIILKITNSKSKLIFKPLPGDDPKQRQPEISLMKKVLNWSPKTSFVDGIEQTAQYFKSIQ